jgi:adenosylhomocysteine nucleosidase
MRACPKRDSTQSGAKLNPHAVAGRVVDGVLASSDMWNEELDRIAYFRERWHTSVEEMETAPAAQVARASAVPFLGIRVVSNNVANGGIFDPKTAAA